MSANDITEVYELKGVEADILKENIGKMSGGLHGFLERAIEKFEHECKAERKAREIQSNENVTGLATHIDERIGAIESVLAPKKEKPKVHIDLQHKIEQLTMQELPQTCWPKSSVVDALASAIDKVKKDTEVEKPFVYQDLDKYLPSWCFSPFEAELQQEPDKKKKEMDMLSWSLAFDRFVH